MSISVENIDYVYPSGVRALHNVSLTITKGEYVAIMGANGAGKTTLVKHFNGLLTPKNGRVLINDIDTATSSVAELAKRVGFVFQNPDHQLFLTTVEEEIAFGPKNFNVPEEQIQKDMERVVTFLALKNLLTRSPFSLSEGERKRVALASVLVMNPEILILDEPTMGQDAIQKRNIAKMVEELNQEGRTIVLVTHDVEFVAEYQPRVVAMAEGRIVADGMAKEVLTNSDVLTKTKLRPPQITALAWELAKQERSFSRDILTTSELKAKLLPLVGR
jgi:energy-coupling factor transporter ATPase